MAEEIDGPVSVGGLAIKLGLSVGPEPTPPMPLAPIEQSKIIDYKLEDEVIKLYFEGFKSTKIAKHCNDLLAKRADGKTYSELNHTNVNQFIKSKKLELEKSAHPEKTPLAKNSLNLNDKITNIVNILETELDKLRDPNNPIQPHQGELFIRMIRELKSTVELSASIEGKLQPSITVMQFESSIEGFCALVQQCDRLTPEAKKIVIGLAAEHLCNPALLKPVTGKVIRGN